MPRTDQVPAPKAGGGGAIAAPRPAVETDAQALEAQAEAEVRGYERAMAARAEQAFPEDKGDPIRLYGEGLAQGGVAFLRSMGKLTRAAELRLRSLLVAGEETAEAQRQRAEEIRQAALARMQADQAAVKADLVAAVRSGGAELLRQDRKAQKWRVLGLTALGCAALVGTAGTAGYRWGRSDAGLAATAELERLRAEAAAANTALAAGREQLVAAASEVRSVAAEAGAGLGILRAMGTLPQAELEATQGIVNDLAANARGLGQSPQLAALREAMAMPSGRRRDAVEFAKIEDGGLRGNLLALAQTAAARQGQPWWQGESTYKGCLANGPVLTTASGVRQPTCLVALPIGWAARPDAVLRNNYPAPGQ